MLKLIFYIHGYITDLRCGPRPVPRSEQQSNGAHAGHRTRCAALRIHVAEVGFCQKTPRGPSTCEGILANEMRSARSYRHASAPSAVRPRHEYALGPSSRQYLMKEVIRCHQASSAVLSRPQQSSGVISRTHQRTIDSTSSSSGVIRRHQASSVISVRSTPRHPAVVGAPNREHLAAVGRRVAKEENARPCPPLGGRHTEHRALTPLRPRLNELAVVPVGRRGVAPW